MAEINLNPRKRSALLIQVICLPMTVLFYPSLAWSAIEVTVRTIEQDQISGRLVHFSLEGGLIIQPRREDQQIVIPSGNLVRISQLHVPPVTQSETFCLLLEGGDRLFGTISAGSPDQIAFDTVLQKPISIPLERIRACLTAQADQPRWQKAVQRLIHSTRDEDQVLLSNGDMLRGFVIEIGPHKIRFERDDREIEIGFDVVVAIVLAVEPKTPNEGMQAHFQFIDGSTLTVPRVLWSAEGLNLSFFDGTLQGLPPEMVQHIEICGSKWTWLDKIEPAAYQHTPFLSLTWPFRVNQNVVGGDLSIGGQVFQHGIGVHSRSTLIYKLDGQYRSFTVRCGMDDSAGPLADVSASIVVDGEERWRENHIKAGSPTRRLRIDVSGARVLELRVDFGENGDMQDRFDWADAALIR